MTKRCIQSEISGYTLEYFNDLHDAYMKTIQSIDHKIHMIPWENEQEVNYDQEVDHDRLADPTCEYILNCVRKISIE